MSLAYGTATATANHEKAIQNFERGDPVLAGSPAGRNGLTWKTMRVGFSEGTSGGQMSVMVFISFGESRIVCTRDHPFLLPDGKIKRADRLVPGVDRLVDAEGKPIEILQISVGELKGGVHSIATDNKFNGSLDNHLLITAGVVTGDYWIEINFGELSKNGLATESGDETPA